jgi:hypothetical protein
MANALKDELLMFISTLQLVPVIRVTAKSNSYYSTDLNFANISPILIGLRQIVSVYAFFDNNCLI